MDKDAENANIQLHISKGNYHAAINLAISAVNACRRSGDQAGVDAFLDVIQSIVNIMFDQFASKR